jgi:hypothetical protein
MDDSNVVMTADAAGTPTTFCRTLVLAKSLRKREATVPAAVARQFARVFASERNAHHAHQTKIL